MKPCSSTIVFMSVLTILFIVTLITLLSSQTLPDNNENMALSVINSDN